MENVVQDHVHYYESVLETEQLPRSIFAEKYQVGWKRHVAQAVKVLKGLVSRGNR